MPKFQPSEHRDEAIDAAKESLAKGVAPKIVQEDLMRRFGVSETSAKRYIRQIIKPNEPPPKKSGATVTQTFNPEQTKEVRVGVTGPALSEIDIVPGKQTADGDQWGDALRCYREMKRKYGITDDFGTVVADGVGLLLEIMETGGITVPEKEANNGASPGPGEGQNRGEQQSEQSATDA
jgi:hypothetical protein